MSYILDALRRADSEREREKSAVPGLHTQAVPAGAVDGEPDLPRRGWLPWALAAAFVVLIGLVGWLWLDRSAPAPTLAAPMPTTPPAAPAAVPPVAAVAPPTALPAIPPSTLPPMATPQPKGQPSGERRPSTPSSTASTRSPDTANRSAKPVAKEAASAKASEPEIRISTLNELPEDIRRGLPNIAVGGSVYSRNPANRMLVINGQVFHEGDELANGLVLEQIRQKAAILKIKGYRYEVPF